ncbi:unnamed protein product [Soboliphyme baturini]|uniref:Iso_dh domain-containing protein n=1 Tax=Soboliphyme baturini TaxID=241478 RepID=A0A183J9X6_9BILA|nr:unnamed protein product [Soboliphyme baturini]
MASALKYQEQWRKFLELQTWVPVEFEPVDVTAVFGRDGKMHIPTKCIDMMRKNKIGLKGPLATPIGKGHRSLNLALRK